ncbi:MAG: alpha-L-arabinofuranosidase C-terminal domain-containing protein [Chitinophagaceae bacterium]
MRRRLSFIKLTTVLIFLVCVRAGNAQPPGGKKISTDLFGLFFEDINYAADGGLYAEMVQNRSFEYNPAEKKEWHPLSYWEYVTTGYSYGKISVATSHPAHPNNPHYIELDIEHIYDKKTGGVGIKNFGYDGMVVKAGDKYNFSMLAAQMGDQPVMLTVSLQDRKGGLLAATSFSTTVKDWKKYTASLVPSANSDSAVLVVLANTEGKLAVDAISLFPEKTFKERPNGLRPDLAQLLADMHPKFVRFPGGCLAHGDGVANMYRWKNTIGPVEERIEQRNLWGYHQTAGLGYYEYFLLCEDIGAKPLPVLPAAVSCQNSGGTWRIGGTGQMALPIEDMQEYIQEIIDLVEWANGPVTSTWGAKRAAAGHPASFNLQYIGIGNEDKITTGFEERFKMIYAAVKAKHPEITIIGTAGPFSEGEDFTKGTQLVNDLGVPVVDEHYYKKPEWFVANQYRYDGYDRHKAHVYLGEYASWGNTLQNAVSEALYMTALERNGDVVRLASYAPLFAKKNFTQWTTDMIFFDNSSYFLTPNYYVQKMFIANQGDYYFDKVIARNASDSSLAGSCVYDSKSGDLILKLVNAGKESKSLKINLAAFKKIMPTAVKIELSGSADAANSFEHPGNISPVTSGCKVTRNFNYWVPPVSATVIRIKTK